VLKGFVPTPAPLVDHMVDKLFRAAPPTPSSTLLDPGCGAGAFVEGVIRWCTRGGAPIPWITALDSDPKRLEEAGRTLPATDRIKLVQEDFLAPRRDQFDYIIGNPPYVAITGLDAEERARYRRQYRTAVGRFDLYVLFFEQALRLLKPGGRLVFVTPEKFLYVQSASQLRQHLAAEGIEEIELIDEGSFAGLVTYPAITTVTRREPGHQVRVVTRDGTVRKVPLRASGASWLPEVNGVGHAEAPYSLPDACLRISCGVATGADGIFVVPDEKLPPTLSEFAHATISGREIAIGKQPRPRHQMLIPYSRDGELLSEEQLGPLGSYLAAPARKARLSERTCVARKPWYAFHENPPLDEILRPKILCKDIGARPWFVVDEEGSIVPRHSVYYLVPKDANMLHGLCEYLNSPLVTQFLAANCQRAANGFLRLQSHVLKRVPLPEHLVADAQMAIA
jgi:SAM-dependent methyltransferase